MNQFVRQLQEQLEKELLFVQSESGMLKTAERSVVVIQKKLAELRDFIYSYTFHDKEEEICFFKEVKPEIYARLIYFLRLFNIESRKPKNCQELYGQLIENELKEISRFFSQNIEFYQYCINGSTHLDEKYFIRGNTSFHLGLDDYSMLIDAGFSTPYSCKLAQVKAYESLSVYFNNILENEINPVHKLSWTASKTALVELIYAFQSYGVFNNGNSDLREVAGLFERLFGISLGNYYRTFQDIRIRKSGRTTFLDELKERLIRRMDETDEDPKIMYSN